jgi:hypothetical protein
VETDAQVLICRKLSVTNRNNRISACVADNFRVSWAAKLNVCTLMIKDPYELVAASSGLKIS